MGGDADKGEMVFRRLMKKYAGLFAAFVSALIFGVTPVLGKLSYEGGSNGITLTFLRAAFAIPLLLVILIVQKVPLRITRREAIDLLAVGILGPAATTILLYTSYQYVAVGVATILHFVYPMTVTLAGLLFFKSKVSKAKLVSLLLGAGGVILFFEKYGSVGMTGIIFALASSLSYTLYMIGVERTSLGNMYPFKLSFYFCLVSFIISGLFGVFTSNLTFALTPSAWLYSFLVSVLVSIGAITLFQIAITRIGASTTAILSTLEPITSVLLGTLILSETLSSAKVTGVVAIITSVLIITLAQVREDPAQ